MELFDTMSFDQYLLIFLCGLAVTITLCVPTVIFFLELTRPSKPQNSIDLQPFEQCTGSESADLSRVSEKVNGTLEIGSNHRAWIRGQRNGKQFSLAFKRDSADRPWTATASVQLNLRHDIVIKPEQYFSPDDLEIGASNFDGCVHLTGNPAYFSAVLGLEARAIILRFQTQGDYVLNRDMLSAFLPSDKGWIFADMLVEQMTRLAVLLTIDESDIPKRLSERACGSGRGSELAGLRLLAHFPGHPMARELARLKPAYLEAFSTAVLDENIDKLIGVLKTEDDQYRQAAIELLRQKGTSAAIGPLRKLAKGHRKAAVFDAIRAIENRGDIPGGGSLTMVEHRERGKLTVMTTTDQD